jgi:hypothetical protein
MAVVSINYYLICNRDKTASGYIDPPNLCSTPPFFLYTIPGSERRAKKRCGRYWMSKNAFSGSLMCWFFPRASFCRSQWDREGNNDQH